MSDELAMEIIENLSEELGQKELRIMELEKEVRMYDEINKRLKINNNKREGFYYNIAVGMIDYNDEGAWSEWTDGIFSHHYYDNGTEEALDMKIELFLDLYGDTWGEMTVEEYINDTDYSAINNVNDIQEEINKGKIINVNNDRPWSAANRPKPLHALTRLLIDSFNAD